MLWTFRRWGVILYGQIPTLLGLFLALAVFALLRPKLNALTLGCAAALIGLGIDFTIHILTQCFAEFGKGRCTASAIQTAIRETGGSLTIAGATTIAAFAAFLFSEQHFLRDMGVLAGLGIFFCLLLSVLLLPSLLACIPRRRQIAPPRALGVPRLLTLPLQAPRSVLAGSALLCLAAIAILLWRPPGFETDLRHIHAANSPALQVQADLTALFGGSQEPLSLLLEGKTETQVLQAMQRLQPGLNEMVQEGTLAAVSSLGAIYSSSETQQAVLRRLQRKDPNALRQTLTASLREAGFDTAAYADYIARIQTMLALQTPLGLVELKALGLQALWDDFLGHDEAGAAGLVVLFPKQELWQAADRQAISQRVTDLLATLGLRGTLSGLYTVSAESAARIGADFRRITLLAMVFIVAIIALRFRRPRYIALVLLPVSCGALWTAGLFAWLDFKLNFMNIAILPMLLGIGIDDGIHIVHRFQISTSHDVRETLSSTGTAVCLTSLTTLLAFGTLALSANQGIASVGLLSLLGITASLLASLLTLPAALRIWEK
jgi:predicted RND superfamily exporter protein